MRRIFLETVNLNVNQNNLVNNKITVMEFTELLSHFYLSMSVLYFPHNFLQQIPPPPTPHSVF